MHRYFISYSHPVGSGSCGVNRNGPIRSFEEETR